MEEKKERWKIEELVFDKQTLLSLNRIVKKGLIEEINYVVSTGKEANVYRAKAPRGYLAVKIYKIETSKFFRRKKYLFSDPRFNFSVRNERELVYIFSSKEFKNLLLAKKAGVRVPSPIYYEKNIIVMKFLGRKGVPFPLLIDSFRMVEDKEELFFSILNDIRRMHKKGFVHGDISEFNIMFDPEKQRHFLIDFGQGTVRNNPIYVELVERDVRNVVRFFSKLIGKKLSFEEALSYVYD